MNKKNKRTSVQENKPNAINIKDLPLPPQDVDTQQPEEFIDKSSIRKDENDLPQKEKENFSEQEEKPTPRNQ